MAYSTIYMCVCVCVYHTDSMLKLYTRSKESVVSNYLVWFQWLILKEMQWNFKCVPIW